MKTPASHDSGARVASRSVPLPTIEEIFGLTVAAARERLARLTQREQQVAALIASDKTNRVIAEELGISVKTLDVHRTNVKMKLRADTLAQIANVVNLVRVAEATIAV